MQDIEDRVLGVWKDAVVDYVIKPEKVALRPGGSKTWTCRSCHRPHLHPGAGLCTKCLTPLPAEPQQYNGVLEDDYYAWKAAHRTGDFALRTAELTGQTDRLRPSAGRACSRTSSSVTTTSLRRTAWNSSP